MYRIIRKTFEEYIHIKYIKIHILNYMRILKYSSVTRTLQYIAYNIMNIIIS